MAGLPGAGRPAYPDKERRKVYIMVRLTEEEKQLVREAAKLAFCKPSEYMRSVILQHCAEKLGESQQKK